MAALVVALAAAATSAAVALALAPLLAVLQTRRRHPPLPSQPLR
jgi:hypothetical protein